MGTRRIIALPALGIALGTVSAAAVLAVGVTHRAPAVGRADVVVGVGNIKWTPGKP
jgi:hypothetical protein